GPHINKETTVSYSHDGKDWWIREKQIKTDFAKQLRIGVAAVNNCAKDMTVEFDDLKIAAK
ncbi:MAG: hypothetical protein ACREHD_18915, partial [Pirellulales bacterium]